MPRLTSVQLILKSLDKIVAKYKYWIYFGEIKTVTCHRITLLYNACWKKYLWKSFYWTKVHSVGNSTATHHDDLHTARRHQEVLKQLGANTKRRRWFWCRTKFCDPSWPLFDYFSFNVYYSLKLQLQYLTTFSLQKGLLYSITNSTNRQMYLLYVTLEKNVLMSQM